MEPMRLLPDLPLRSFTYMIFRCLETKYSPNGRFFTGNLPQDSASVCINIDISPEMAAQSAQQNQAFLRLVPILPTNMKPTNMKALLIAILTSSVLISVEINGNQRREEYRGTSPLFGE